jgi:hypothetical protein
LPVIVSVLDALIWAAVALATFGSASDPATAGLDRTAGIAATAVFVLTTVPAVVLTSWQRAPRAALMLALAFPALLALLLAAAIVAWQR